MAMYNLIEYNDNYSDTSGSLRQFKRNEVPDNNANLSVDDLILNHVEAVFVGKT